MSHDGEKGRTACGADGTSKGSLCASFDSLTSIPRPPLSDTVNMSETTDAVVDGGRMLLEKSK